MHLQRMRFLLVAPLLVVSSFQGFSQPLEDLVQQALSQSVQIQNIELQKQDALLQKGISESEETLGISVSSGEVNATYDPSSNSYVFGTSGMNATFVLPNDEETTITVSTGTLKWKAPDALYALSPSVSASHTLTYGYADDNRETLLTQHTELTALNAYDASRLTFTNTLYEHIKALLENEQSIKKTEKDIADLKRTLAQNLSLKTLREGSLAYTADTQEISSKEVTLKNLQAPRLLLLKQFTAHTGFAWEGVDSIDVPDLSFTPSPQGTSAVQLKSLEVAMAKEDLALKMAELVNKDLVLSGSLGVSSANSATISPTIPNSEQLNTNFTSSLKAQSYTLSASVGGTYDFDDRNFSPSLTVSGSWNNNPASAADRLRVQQLENAVLLAEIELTTEQNAYQQNAVSLENSIAEWNLAYALLEQTMQYHNEILDLQQTLLAKGLATQSEVDDARFTMEMDAYTLATTLLDGLHLENEIRLLQL